MYVLVGAGPFDSSNISKEEQFRLVRSSYRKKVLKHHPDKGGDIEAFRLLQSAFEYLRDHVYADDAIPVPNIVTKRDEFETTYNEVSKRDVPSWEFYKEAPEESVPIYLFQYAVSKNSTCIVCRTKIEEGELRIGKLNVKYGSYGKFSKLHCFSWKELFPFLDTFDFGNRKTWKKFYECLEQMEGLYIRGFFHLHQQDKKEIATLLLKEWKSKGKVSEQTVTVSKKRKKTTEVTTTTTKLAKASQELVSQELVIPEDKPTFVVPEVTPKNRNKLKNQVFVCTGIFPELGGGSGINVGKERLREMIESFGGIYKDHLSKKNTTFLIEGKDKGNEKSQNAYRWKIPRMSLHDLKLYIEDVEEKRFLQAI